MTTYNIEVKFSDENAAFDQDGELERTISNMAKSVLSMILFNRTHVTLSDSNGNKIGLVKVIRS